MAIAADLLEEFLLETSESFSNNKTFKVLMYDSYFGNNFDQYYENIADIVGEGLVTMYDMVVDSSLDSEISYEVVKVPKNQMAAYLSTGEYDVFLHEIDLWDINSAYRALYWKIDANTNNMLETTKWAASINTYSKYHWYAQVECFEDATMINLGWQQKVLITNSGVSGFTMPDGFCPTGNLARLDFRYIYKTID